MRTAAAVALLFALAVPAHACLDFEGYCVEPLWRSGEIAVGDDLAKPDPATGLVPHANALNFTGQNPPGGPWLVSVPTTAEAACVDTIETLPGGKQCGGLCARVGASGKALCVQTCNQKSTGTLELLTLNLATRAFTLLKPALAVPLNTYGGSNPPANCEHRADGGNHAYCQIVRTCLAVTQAGSQVTVTGTTSFYGSGPKNDPSRYDLAAPLSLVGSSSWTGPLPSGVPASGTGTLAILATSVEQQALSVLGLEVE